MTEKHTKNNIRWPVINNNHINYLSIRN